ncbi:thioredoxin domain-containing protein [Agreia pratensis]|uniref:Protein-disulfide isomerase n=1 Tax=Agreia pratensis TaxID=150121 RepID=A0A1X7JVX5_9MICO|nr:thioredoxin domain-containing protein [Agreia pratensis]MBF4635545.1 thioredoxin domain-containing protein [Agreia pratensis]SMG31865.1 Protein-disulfide isomerase [Agreia pratensis]
MSYGSAGDGRLSKNERREAAREKAKVLREQQRKKDLRNRIFLFGGLGVVVIAIGVAVTLIIVSAIKPAGPGPMNMASDGVTVSKGFVATTAPAQPADAEPVVPTPDYSNGVVDIQVYVDYLCPFCGQFESTNSEQIGKWIDSGAATLTTHPLAILDRGSLGTKYSTRSANAAACVANYSPDSFFAYSALLFKNQPAENTEGLDNAALKGYVTDAKADKVSQIEKCIDDTEFKDWVSASTARALKGPLPNTKVEKVEGTPTVLVNGQQYSGSLTDADAFSAFVLQVAGEAYSTATPAPTPEPTVSQ